VGDGARAATTEVFEGATVVDTVLEEVDDFLVTDIDYGGTLVEKVPYVLAKVSYGPPWAHYLCGYQDRLLGGPLGLPDLRCTAPDGVKDKDYRGEVLG
jgi:hypothetical protein